MDKALKLKLVTSAVLAALSQSQYLYAAEEAAAAAEAAAPAATEVAPVATEAAPAAEAAADTTPLNLDKIVVTGTAKKISKMKSSVSISTLDAKQIQNTGATNAAELLRSIPGIRSESSSGDGNANMTVRGLPISAGGARYLQLQEDGLPLLQFGDIAFSTPDQWLRADYGVNKVEAIRGGSGSTMGTNSPGGIVNFITNDGKAKVGKIGFTTGVNMYELRTDFAYGAPISDTTRGFISGFYRGGDGLRDANANMFQGGQIKANLTHDFDAGFIRVNLKYLDDQAPTNMPLPATFSASGRISKAQGIDLKDGTLYDRNFPKDVFLKGNNSTSSSNVNDGLQVKSTAIGFEFDYDLAGFNINNKFRHAENDGRWTGIYPYGFAGVDAAGNYNVSVFNVANNDMGNTLNDFKLSKAFNIQEGVSITPTLGLYYSKQNVDLTWNFNSYRLNTNNKSATLIGNTSQTFGGCCGRDIDVEYETLSPYVGLALEANGLNLDASVRRERQDADGSYTQVTAGANTYDAVNKKDVDYSLRETSYSVGANYQFNKDLAVFARTSRGYTFNADRIMFGGGNSIPGQNPLGGNFAIPINEVKQHELGAKWRNGDLSTFVTLFKADVDESNFEATTQISSQNSYEAKGVEIEMGYAIGNFRIGGGLTYTDAEIVKSNNKALEGTVPNRQAKFIYQFTPSYRFNDQLNIGASIVGTSSSEDGNGSAKMAGFTVFNPYLNYAYDKNWTVNLMANNVFDTVGITEANKGDGVARSIDGRTIRASLVYSF